MGFEMGSRSLGTEHEGTGTFTLLTLTPRLKTRIRYEIQVKLRLLTILKILNFQHPQSRGVRVLVP